MQLNDEQIERIELLFETADANPHLLNKWEQGFIADNHQRYIDDDGGEFSDEGYFVSGKMWKILYGIENKLGIV